MELRKNDEETARSEMLEGSQDRLDGGRDAEYNHYEYSSQTLSLNETRVRSRSNSHIKDRADWYVPASYTPLSTVIDEYSDDRNWKSEISDTAEPSISSRTYEKYHVSNPTFNWSIVFAWFALVTAVIAGAAIGPAFKLLNTYHIEPMLVASWRSQCMILSLAPFACMEWYQRNRPKLQAATKLGVVADEESSSPPIGDTQNAAWFTLSHPAGLTSPLWVYILLAGLSWSATLIFWTESLRWTSTVKASITVGTHPIMLVLYFAVSRLPVHALEGIGVLVAFWGLSLAVLDEDAEAEEFGMRKKLLGLGMCLIAAIGQTIVIINWSLISNYVSIIQYTISTTCIVGLVSSFCSVVFMGSEFSFNISYGVFGWLSTRWFFPIVLFSLGLGIAYIAGTNFAMKHISPLVFSSCLLMDPAATGLISWLLKLEDLPGLCTIGGGVIVISGIALIIIGEHKRKVASAVDARTDVPDKISWQDPNTHEGCHDNDDLSGIELFEKMQKINVVSEEENPNEFPSEDVTAIDAPAEVPLANSCVGSNPLPPASMHTAGAELYVTVSEMVASAATSGATSASVPQYY